MQIFLTSLHSRRSKNHPILFLLLCCPLKKKGTNSTNISTRKTTIKQGSKLPSRLFTVPRELRASSKQREWIFRYRDPDEEQRNMFVLESMIRILTKLSMCLPASIKFPKFKHHELDRYSNISPFHSSIIEDIRRIRNPIRRWMVREEWLESIFSPTDRTTTRDKNKRKNSFNPVSSRNHRAIFE